MNRRVEIAKYIIADFIISSGVWVLFWLFRKAYIESEKYGISIPFQLDNKFYAAIIIIPLFWIFLHALAGLYSDVYRKSRIAELKEIFVIDVIGVVILFFSLILNDIIVNYRSYYASISVLFSLQFFLTSFAHLI